MQPPRLQSCCDYYAGILDCQCGRLCPPRVVARELVEALSGEPAMPHGQMTNLNSPAIGSGPVTYADLAAARDASDAYWSGREAFAAHAASEIDESQRNGRSILAAIAPAYNVVFMLLHVSLAMAICIGKESKLMRVAALVVGLPLVLMALNHIFAIWQG